MSVDTVNRGEDLVACAHGCGKRRAPGLECVAFLNGSFYTDFSAVISGNGSDLSAAVGIEGIGVLVDYESCVNCEILSGHSDREDRFLGVIGIEIPAVEGVAFFGLSRGLIYICAVVISNGCACNAVNISCEVILIDSIACGCVEVISGHCCGFGNGSAVVGSGP